MYLVIMPNVCVRSLCCSGVCYLVCYSGTSWYGVCSGYVWVAPESETVRCYFRMVSSGTCGYLAKSVIVEPLRKDTLKLYLQLWTLSQSYTTKFNLSRPNLPVGACPQTPLDRACRWVCFCTLVVSHFFTCKCFINIPLLDPPLYNVALGKLAWAVLPYQSY